MSSTVQVGKMILTGSGPASEMVEALTPPKETDDKPRVVVDQGRRVKPDEQPSKTSEAARELGKLGGKAAAEARRSAVDEQEKRAERQMAKDSGVDTDEGESEGKAKETKGEATDKDADTGEERPPNPRHNAQARIQQLAREKREAEERAEGERRARQALEDRIARLERGEKPAEPAKPQRQAAEADPDRPRPDQFDSYDDYVDALTEYKADQRIKATLEKLGAQREADEAAQGVVKRINTFRERAADPELVSKIDPELAELRPASLLAPGEKVLQGNVLAEEFLQSEHPGELMLYLTEHPEERSRLLNAPDVRTIQRGVALIEERLSKGAPPARQTSKAPPPISTVTPSSVPGNPDLTRAGGFDEFMRLKGGR